MPASFAADAIMEAADAGINVIVCITEGIPTKDMIKVYDYVKIKTRFASGEIHRTLIAGNMLGECKIGIMPDSYIKRKSRFNFKKGTLTYEAVWQLTNLGIGQSTCIGIGGDPVIGTRFIDAVKLFNEDKDTDAI